MIAGENAKHRANAWVWPCLLLLAACSSTPKRLEPPAKPAMPAKPNGYYQDDGPGDNPPANLDLVPDAIPRSEPLHRGANRPYTVLGKTYVPNVASEAFRQSGMASWYGRQFHGQKTSMGETYDMYAMTAAHPTLPLPSYARVTNPQNNRSVIVRVNDRGPFHADRVIDLSYAAATKLDIARRGSGMVTVERVFAGADPASAPRVSPASPASPAVVLPASPITAEAGQLFVQLGAFSSIENAEIFRARVARELTWNLAPIQVAQAHGLYRVRIGPYSSRAAADAAMAQIRAAHDFSPVISPP